MRENNEFRIFGLKCDSCDYADNTIQFSEYESYIDKPCPKCGASLLTKQEYIECLNMYKRFYAYKKVVNVLKWVNPFHYWRLIFGDNRPQKIIVKVLPYRKK